MKFSAKSCKNCLISWNSTRTHRFGQDNATFSNKLPCFGVLMNISAKGFRKLLNWWESTKNHRFGQNFPTFRTNYHVFAFPSTFQEKVAESASFRQKARKIIHLAKSLQLFEQTTMSLHFDELFRKKLQKLPHFVKKHEKPSIWPEVICFRANYHDLAFPWTFHQWSSEKYHIWWKSTRNHRFGKNYPTSWANYHVFAFWWTFKEEVGKSCSFRKKAWKLMHFLRTWHFSKKLPCFNVSLNFSEKSCKNCVISWKRRKTIDLGKTMQLFLTNYHGLGLGLGLTLTLTPNP